MSATAVARLAARVAADMATYDDPAVQRSVLGVVEPTVIAQSFVTWVQQHLRVAPLDCWLWAVSVGCVAGFDLADGSKAVVKAYAHDHTEASLLSMHAIQRAALRVGVPVPEPLAGPEPLGASLATADAALLDGRHPNLRNPADRVAAAKGFAEFIDALRGVPEKVAATRPISKRSVSGLYPVPHSPLFDFDATAKGAEWIDELAHEAKTRMDRLDADVVLTHMDWRGENLRVSEDGDRVVGIYDCDAIRREREAVAVGEAAATHTIDWSDPHGPYFASGSECIEFARTIEAVRGRPFSDAEWSVIRAGTVYAWSYTARCEHARAMAGDDKPQFRMRGRLAADGRSILDDVI
jgi:Phosphotransferase enzyme family